METRQVCGDTLYTLNGFHEEVKRSLEQSLGHVSSATEHMSAVLSKVDVEFNAHFLSTVKKVKEVQQKGTWL